MSLLKSLAKGILNSGTPYAMACNAIAVEYLITHELTNLEGVSTLIKRACKLLPVTESSTNLSDNLKLFFSSSRVVQLNLLSAAIDSAGSWIVGAPKYIPISNPFKYEKKIDDTEIIMAAIQFKRETGYVVRLNNQPLLISDFPELEDLLGSPIEDTKPASQLTTDSSSASSFTPSPNTADNNTSQIQKALSFCLLFIGITAWIFSTVAVGAASGHNPGSIGEVFICLSVITISSCFILSLVDRLRYKDPINNYFSLKNIFTIYAVTLLFFYPVHVSTKKNATTGVKEASVNQLTDQREAPQESMVEEKNQISNAEQKNTQTQSPTQTQIHGDWVIREFEHNETIDAYTLAEDETLFGTVCFKLSKECHTLYSQSHFTCELGKNYQYIFKTNNGFASSNTATCANKDGALILLNNPETMLSNISGEDQFTISIVGYSKSTFSPKGYKEAVEQLKQFF